MNKPVPAWMFHRHRPGDAWDGMGIQMVIRPELDNFVREVVQNVIDQRSEPDSPARVEFVVRDHHGEDADRILSLIGWDTGLKTHMRGVAEGQNHLSEKLKSALAVAEDRVIRTLTIRDSFTNGLTGPELSGGNFANLCRHVMVTEHGGKARGGAFGIGKSVLWAFSRGSVVFFSSRFFDDEKDEMDFRLIGRCYFPSHIAEGIADGERFEGNAWFGMPTKTNNDDWTRSLRELEATEHSAGSPLERDQASTGTSIMIPFFGSPVDESDPEGEDLKSEISHSIVKWFWPALHGGLLEAFVAYGDSQKSVVLEPVELRTWIQPYIRSLDYEGESEIAEEIRSCARGQIDLRIPGRKARDNQHEGMEAQVALSVTRLSDQEAGLIPEGMLNRVALVRGVRMVVQYLGGLPDSLPAFVGVLRAGTLHGEGERDKAAEYFLRDSEPPAHDKWESTPKLKENYKAGGINALTGLLSNIRTRARGLLGSSTTTTGRVPRKLAELLKGRRPGTEKLPPSKPRVIIADPEILRSGLFVIAKCSVKGQPTKPWTIVVHLAARTEDNRRISLDHAGSDVKIVGADGVTWGFADSEADSVTGQSIVPSLFFSVPTGVKEFKVEFSASGGFLGAEVLSRSRVEVASKGLAKLKVPVEIEESSDE